TMRRRTDRPERLRSDLLLSKRISLLTRKLTERSLTTTCTSLPNSPSERLAATLSPSDGSTGSGVAAGSGITLAMASVLDSEVSATVTLFDGRGGPMNEASRSSALQPG